MIYIFFVSVLNVNPQAVFEKYLLCVKICLHVFLFVCF